MFERRKTIGSLLGLGMSVVLCGGSAALAQDAAWHVGKSSGEVWLTGAGVQQASLGGDTVLKPGDTIRTGRNGRVLLVRGEETILISPNSVIGIPAAPKDGLSTTIVQQAGEILLEVEKRNVKHFEVETPFFAAVVKGTQFRVSVDKSDSHVDVLRGQVEVADFKSGQYAMVLPGQVAKVLSRSVGGLLLSGAGALSPILKGTPRTPAVKLVPVPRDGLTAPTDVPKGQQIRLASLTGAAPRSVRGAGQLRRRAIRPPSFRRRATRRRVRPRLPRSRSRGTPPPTSRCISHWGSGLASCARRRRKTTRRGRAPATMFCPGQKATAMAATAPARGIVAPIAMSTSPMISS